MSKDEAVSDEVSSDGQLDSGQVPTEAVAPGDALEVSAQSAPVAEACLLYTSPSPRDGLLSRMPSSA